MHKKSWMSKGQPRIRMKALIIFFLRVSC